MTDVASSTVPIQFESIETTAPVSESMLSSMGGAINFLLKNKNAVGDVMLSALDEATFQNQRDTTWVLADGRSVVGSSYQALTGQTNIPDFRGVFPRGKDNGRGIDPNGNSPIGTYRADVFADHHHATVINAIIHTGGPPLQEGNGYNFQVGNTDDTGGNETAPKTVIINFFIKINISV